MIEPLLIVLVLALIAGGGIIVIDAFVIRQLRRLAAARSGDVSAIVDDTVIDEPDGYRSQPNG